MHATVRDWQHPPENPQEEKKKKKKKKKKKMFKDEQCGRAATVFSYRGDENSPNQTGSQVTTRVQAGRQINRVKLPSRAVPR